MPRSVLQDPCLMYLMPWKCIEDMCVLESAYSRPRRRLRENGLLDIEGMDPTVFYRNFRFDKDDLGDLIAALLIPSEVMSAQHARVLGREALCMTLRRLAYPNRLCDLEILFNRHSSVISSVVSKVMSHVECHFGRLLADLTVHRW
ncbi:hypothetical protein HPB50_017910 [Hyalomma asiaticum]|uniref:Uncharacterized protein n=1 Tax=Hyalomma asiaticum TaxID=266040 RepID=A0ACB7RU95_HYAAI|nr:hypothetical protein HPB50_017910 [Hyalomma asiaticum]